METSTTALARSTATALHAAVDDPRALDDEQLLELLKSFHARTTAVGAVAVAVSSGAAVALTVVLPVATLALAPAAVAGFVLSNRAVRAATSSRYGVTPRCAAAVEAAFDRAQRKMKLGVADLFRTDWQKLLPLVRAELDELRP